MRKGGVEPPPLAGLDPKSSASANSATFAAVLPRGSVPGFCAEAGTGRAWRTSELSHTGNARKPKAQCNKAPRGCQCHLTVRLRLRQHERKWHLLRSPRILKESGSAFRAAKFAPGSSFRHSRPCTPRVRKLMKIIAIREIMWPGLPPGQPLGGLKPAAHDLEGSHLLNNTVLT